jgi:hypothetical protein
MIRLRQTFGAHAGRSLEFDSDLVTLGRLPESNVPFDPRADIDASGRHAELRRERGWWVVVDVGSRNGTWVNGQRVERTSLNVGDELEFGRGGPRFVVEAAQTGTGAAPPASSGGLMPTAQWPATDGSIPDVGGGPAGSQPPPFRAPSSRPPASFRGPAGHAPAAARSPASEPPPSFRGAASQPPPAFRGPVSEPPPRFRAPLGASPSAGVSPAAFPVSEPPARGRGEGVPMHFVPGGGAGGAPGPAARAGGDPPATTPRARASGLGLGAAIAVGLVALIFAGLAVGFLASRLRGASARGTARTQLPAATAPAILGARIGPAVYLVSTTRADGSTAGLCTAFAVRADVAATSGRCVTLAEQERSRGARVALIRPGFPGSVGVATMYRHPQFDASAAGIANDVGVIRVTATFPAVVPLPTLQALQAFAPGEPADVVAYAVAGGVAPRPLQVAVGALGAPMRFDGTPGAFESTQLVPHSARVEEGGAGAPMFDGAGVLVGVHASPEPANPSLGVRADVLLALLAGLGA